MKSKAEYQRNWRATNPNYHAKWYAANRERVAARTKDYRARNKAALAAKFKAWRAANTETHRAVNRRCRERNRAALADDYVRWMLAQNSTLSPKDIPEPLVALQREKLKLKRLCRSLQT